MNELQNLMGKDKKVLFDRNHIKCKRFDEIEDGHVRLIGHQYGAFWTKLSAVKERL